MSDGYVTDLTPHQTGISVVTINQRISYDFPRQPCHLEQSRRGSRRPRSWSSSVGTHPCPCASKLSDGRPSTPAPINDRTTLKSLGKRLYNSLGVTTQRLHTSFPPPPRPAKMVNSTVSEASLLYANTDFTKLNWLETQWAAWYLWIGNPILATGLASFLLHEVCTLLLSILCGRLRVV